MNFTATGDDTGASLPFLDFDTSVQLDALPLGPFQACLSRHHADASPTTHHHPSPPSTPQSCDCARPVFETIRSLNTGNISHDTLTTLRQGTSLFEQLLTCRICYDVSKPPRMTLQNVLLIGRLILEVSTLYRRYLQFLKEPCAGAGTKEAPETVYLSSSVAFIGISLSRTKLYEIVKDGLRDDAARLAELGRQFEIRQKNRHLIGHGACPDKEGHCRKAKDNVDPDPFDICPQDPAARALIPCYQVVDEVKTRIKAFETALSTNED